MRAGALCFGSLNKRNMQLVDISKQSQAKTCPAEIESSAASANARDWGCCSLLSSSCVTSRAQRVLSSLSSFSGLIPGLWLSTFCRENPWNSLVPKTCAGLRREKVGFEVHILCQSAWQYFFKKKAFSLWASSLKTMESIIFQLRQSDIAGKHSRRAIHQGIAGMAVRNYESVPIGKLEDLPKMLSIRFAAYSHIDLWKDNLHHEAFLDSSRFVASTSGAPRHFWWFGGNLWFAFRNIHCVAIYFCLNFEFQSLLFAKENI